MATAVVKPKRKLVAPPRSADKKQPKTTGSEKPNLAIFRSALSPDLLKRAHALFFGKEHATPIRYLEPHENKVWTPAGEYREVPRKQAAYSHPAGLSYRFSGATVVARDENEVPLLREIREWVEKLSGQAFNFCFINYYQTGDNTIGWHSDDEKDMINGATIGSLTFGASRDFQFRLKKDKTVKFELVLDDNMLVLMKHPTNRDWQHQLPRRKRVFEPRVNLTFRQFKSQTSLF